MFSGRTLSNSCKIALLASGVVGLFLVIVALSVFHTEAAYQQRLSTKTCAPAMVCNSQAGGHAVRARASIEGAPLAQSYGAPRIGFSRRGLGAGIAPACLPAGQWMYAPGYQYLNRYTDGNCGYVIDNTTLNSTTLPSGALYSGQNYKEEGDCSPGLAQQV